MQEWIVNLESWTLPEKQKKTWIFWVKNGAALSLPSLLKSASQEMHKNCGFSWVPSIHFLQGREVLQSQDYSLEYRISEMVSFKPTLQFIMMRDGLGFSHLLKNASMKYWHDAVC